MVDELSRSAKQELLTGRAKKRIALAVAFFAVALLFLFALFVWTGERYGGAHRPADPFAPRLGRAYRRCGFGRVGSHDADHVEESDGEPFDLGRIQRRGLWSQRFHHRLRGRLLIHGSSCGELLFLVQPLFDRGDGVSLRHVIDAAHSWTMPAEILL